MKALDLVVAAAAVTSLVAFPFSLYYFCRKPMQSALLFGLPLLLALGAGEVSQRLGQAEVLDALDAFNREYQISINGTAAPNPNDVMLALKKLSWRPAHHSNPTKKIQVAVRQDSRHLVLSLARGSGDPQEYWVFYPKYYVTSRNEIGRIVTPLFDQY